MREPPFGPLVTGGDYTSAVEASALAGDLLRGDVKPELVWEPVVRPAPWTPAPFVTPFERAVVWLRSLFDVSRREGMLTVSVGPVVLSIGDTPWRRQRRLARLMAQRPPRGAGIEDTIAWHRHRADLGERRLG